MSSLIISSSNSFLNFPRIRCLLERSWKSFLNKEHCNEGTQQMSTKRGLVCWSCCTYSQGMEFEGHCSKIVFVIFILNTCQRALHHKERITLLILNTKSYVLSDIRQPPRKIQEQRSF